MPSVEHKATHTQTQASLTSCLFCFNMLEIFNVDIAKGVNAGKQARALLRFSQNNMSLIAVHLLLKKSVK